MTREQLDERRCEGVAKRYVNGEPTPGWRIETVALSDGSCGVFGIEKAPHLPCRDRLQFFWKAERRSHIAA